MAKLLLNTADPKKIDLSGRQTLRRMSTRIQIIYRTSNKDRQVIHGSFRVVVARLFSIYFQTNAIDLSSGPFSQIEVHVTSGNVRAVKVAITWLQNYCKDSTTSFDSDMLEELPLIDIVRIQEAATMLGVDFMQTYLEEMMEALSTMNTVLPSPKQAISILKLPADHRARQSLVSRLVTAVASGQLNSNGNTLAQLQQFDKDFRADFDRAIAEHNTRRACQEGSKRY